MDPLRSRIERVEVGSAYLQLAWHAASEEAGNCAWRELEWVGEHLAGEFKHAGVCGPHDCLFLQ